MTNESCIPLWGENPAFLSQQIITYLGNKRALLSFIGVAVDDIKRELAKDKLDVADMFSGSGVVSRYLKQHADTLYVNDLEDYCERLNRCYLANAGSVNFTALRACYDEVRRELDEKPLESGFITELYSPKNDLDIQPGERAFFTSRNARYLDTARKKLDDIPEPYRTFLLGPLLYEASVHNNTSGVFKGFYKNSATGVGQFGGDGRNALPRILGNIELKMPVFSCYDCDVQVSKEDANTLARELPEVDLAYLDPPYNQHPYGSNYFMLNLINNYRRPTDISRVSGIPANWNKSPYNQKSRSAECLRRLCNDLKAKYLLISFNNEGFISLEEMTDMLSELGDVRVFGKDYNTFRGSRNLNNRDLHVKEYLYLVKKR